MTSSLLQTGNGWLKHDEEIKNDIPPVKWNSKPISIHERADDVDRVNDIEQDSVADSTLEENWKTPEIIFLDGDVQKESYNNRRSTLTDSTLEENWKTPEIIFMGGDMKKENYNRRSTLTDSILVYNNNEKKEAGKTAPIVNLMPAFHTKGILRPMILNKHTKRKVVILYSTYGITSQEERAIRRAINFFETREFPLEYIDAALMCCQNRRVVFEKVSGLKCWWAPKFPQIFIQLEDKSAVYIGDWDRVQELLDCDAMNQEFVSQNNLPTFSAVFKDFIDVKDVK